jgi:predicted dehydrogenase
MTQRLRVAMIGHGFMGGAHSQGWRTAPRVFALPAEVEMALLVGRDAGRAAEAAERWGWSASGDDWRSAVERDDVDVVDVTTPGGTHAEIAIAALEAGKHVLCEKPLSRTIEEGERMRAAAERAASRGVRAMVGFTYRRVPAATFARDLVAQGAIGTVRQVRAQYLQDWLVDPQAPLTWRLQEGGSGALTDTGAHAVDLMQFITGRRIEQVSGVLDTLVRERPVLQERSGLGGTIGEGRGRVAVDDVALFHGRFDDGVLGSFEASRFATGRKNSFRFEISGELGAIAFDLERMNELQIADRTAPAGRQGFTRVVVTEPEHPYLEGWWPTGHMLGYEHGFSHQVKDLVEAISGGGPLHPGFEEGLQVQRVLDAVERSAAASSVWTPVAG